MPVSIKIRRMFRLLRIRSWRQLHHANVSLVFRPYQTRSIFCELFEEKAHNTAFIEHYLQINIRVSSIL